jgi:hypothetical protein
LIICQQFAVQKNFFRQEFYADPVLASKMPVSLQLRYSSLTVTLQRYYSNITTALVLHVLHAGYWPGKLPLNCFLHSLSSRGSWVSIIDKAADSG